MDRDAIKMMIELSETWQEADKIIEKYTHFTATNEKLAYLFGMFDVAIIASHDGSGSKIETDYCSVLSAIVHMKWW
jgi:hypothetical protein